MGLARFAVKMGTLLAGVGALAAAGAAGEKLFGDAIGSHDTGFGLGISFGAIALGLAVPTIAKALNSDDGISDARAVQLGAHNLSRHSGILGVLLGGLTLAILTKTGLIPAQLETSADGTVPRILPVRFWKWLLITIGGCFLAAITSTILYAWLTGTPVGK